MLSRLIIFINRFFKKPTGITTMDKDLVAHNFEKGKRVFKEYNGSVPLRNKLVLDIGCGDGGLSRAFSEWCVVVGIDLMNRIDKKTDKPYLTNGGRAKFILAIGQFSSGVPGLKFRHR